MVLITIFSYHQISSWVDSLTAPFFDKEPLTEGFFDYIYYFGWLITRMVFKAVAAIVVFYISFIFSYTVTSPLYSFISVLAEDIYFGKPEDATDFSLDIMIEDVLQALKIAGMALCAHSFCVFCELCACNRTDNCYRILYSHKFFNANRFSGIKKKLGP
jgi:hypothetical protein